MQYPNTAIQQNWMGGYKRLSCMLYLLIRSLRRAVYQDPDCWLSILDMLSLAE
jgi:hypothetical protein